MAQIGPSILTDVTCQLESPCPMSSPLQTHSSNMYTDAVIPHLYWTGAEAALSILAVCLPAIFQLSRRGHQLGPRALFRSRKRGTPEQHARQNSSKESSGKIHRGFHRLWQDTPASQELYKAGVVSMRGEEPEDVPLPLQRIIVRQDINISYA